jgi:putative ABC transport system permease protein
MYVRLDGTDYQSDPQFVAFFDQAVREVRSVPGVDSAAAAFNIPLDGINGWRGTTIEEFVPSIEDQEIPMQLVVMTPGYLETMTIPLSRGRDFNERDTAGSQGVVIVSQNVAERFWPGQEPLGKRLKYGGRNNRKPWLTVVGVAGDIKHTGLRQDAPLITYRPQAQECWDTMTLVLRPSASSSPSMRTVKSAIWAVDPDRAVGRVVAMEDIVSEGLGTWRVYALLLGGFGGVGLMLAAAGVYGTTSYTVSRRKHEIGLRMAVGAQRTDVLRLVLRQGIIPAVIGLTLGLVGSLICAHLLAGQLYGIPATDPGTYGSVCLLLAASALLACYVPARRATKVDPMVALRHE